MRQPIWLRDDIIRAVNRRQIAEHGGIDAIRDEGALLSALQKPRDLFAYASPTPDLCDLAAAYGFGLARNHPFADGNKRTCLVAMRLFLKLNGIAFEASGASKYKMIMQLAAGDVSQDELADWLRSHCT